MIEPYDQNYRPSAPSLTIRLYSFLQDRYSESFPALIDTGSDGTLLPLHRLAAIGAEESAPAWITGVTGDRRPVATYYIDIALGDVLIPGVRVIAATARNETLLGRDVLNRLSLFLDGPWQSLQIPSDALVNRLRSSAR
jgi:predicted aspartyl protease